MMVMGYCWMDGNFVFEMSVPFYLSSCRIGCFAAGKLYSC